MADEGSVVRSAQAPLRESYRRNPDEALVTDRATTVGGGSGDPFHGAVSPGRGHGEEWPYGVHRAVGGPHDAPVPGDILCSALATCLESTIRLIADRLGVSFEALRVDVRADVDVRGTLVVDRDVPVGFQAMRCTVDMELEDGAGPDTRRKLLGAAERSCVVLQTLRSGVEVQTSMNGD